MGGAVIVDNKVGKNYLLSPRVLDITLTKIEGNRNCFSKNLKIKT